MLNLYFPNMSGPTPDNSQLSEVSGRYNDAISRATKFVISSAIVLTILIIVVGQELREYRLKQTSLVNQIHRTTQTERTLVGELQRKYRQLTAFFPKEQRDSLFDVEYEPEVSIAYVAPALIRTHRKTSRYELESEPENGSAVKTFSDVVGFEPAEIPHKLHSVHKAESIRNLERQDEKLSALIQQTKQGLDAYSKNSAEAPKTPLAEKAKTFLRELGGYKERYQTRISVARELLVIKKESEDLKSAKKSIPTPFGNFQIAPRFALLGLAFALVLTYIPFINWIRTIRGLATEYDTLKSAGAAPLTIPAPFWSPDPAAESSHSNERWYNLSNALLSILIHIIWLGLAVWLIFECLAVWNATKALAFVYKSFWGYLLIATFLGVVVRAAWPYIGPSLKRVSLKMADVSPVRPSRRRFIIAGVIAVLGISSVTLFFRWRKPKAAKLPRPPLHNFTSTADEDWIQNKRTNIVHFEPICSRHLPRHGNRERRVNNSNKGVHTSCQIAILANLGFRLRRAASRSDVKKNPSLQSEGQLAIRYLTKAIELSPLSLPLYDKLAKIYGLFESYDNIGSTYKSGLAHARAQKNFFSNLKDPVRREKKLRFGHRVEKEFELRIKRTEARKQKVETARTIEEKKGTDAKPGATPDGRSVVKPVAPD